MQCRACFEFVERLAQGKSRRHGILLVPPPEQFSEDNNSDEEQPANEATDNCAANAARYRPREIDDARQLDLIGKRHPDNLLCGHVSSRCPDISGQPRAEDGA